MDAMLEANPGNEFALREKAMLYILTTRFDKAHEIYEVLPESDDPEARQLAAIAEWFHGREVYNRSTASTPIAVDKFKEVVAELREHFPNQRPLMSRMLIYDYSIRAELTDYDQVVREMIHAFDPHWKQQVFAYDLGEQHLKLGGEEIHRLAHHNGHGRKSFLAYLPLQSLDISGLNVRVFADLHGLTQLRRLNISDTLISEAPRAADFPMLRELILSPGQLPPQQLERMPDSIELIYTEE